MADEGHLLGGKDGGAPPPGVLTFTYDPATGRIHWKQEGAFAPGAMVNALELCKAMLIQGQLAEAAARAAAEQEQRVQPARGPWPPGLTGR